MGLFNLFKKETPKTMRDALKEIGEPFIANFYRNYTANSMLPLTSKITDKEILEVYQQVGTAFSEVAKQRNETIKSGVINSIVLKFLTLKERAGEVMYNEHLKYELNKYLNEGLRADYKDEINFL